MKYSKLATLSLTAALIVSAAAAQAAEDKISPAENLLFENHYISAFKKPVDLHYKFLKTGSMGDSWHDKVDLKVAANHSVTVKFLTGKRNLAFNKVDNATANPVIMYFLEKDIREMKDLTGGSTLYFQHRIRMALAYHAAVKPVKLTYKGKQVTGQEVRIDPYLDDPMKDRFARYDKKYYVFDLSDAVPGGVYEIRSVVPDSKDQGKSLIDEKLVVDPA